MGRPRIDVSTVESAAADSFVSGLELGEIPISHPPSTTAREEDVCRDELKKQNKADALEQDIAFNGQAAVTVSMYRDVEPTFTLLHTSFTEKSSVVFMTLSH